MKDYRPKIGLEVHAELKSETKIFCGCPTAFGMRENTATCPVCLGLPGSMPRLNRRVVELGAKAGIALHCPIARRFHFDRKQYFYPDLPKAYQISQDDTPLCGAGYLEIEAGDGKEKERKKKRIGIKRIHIEEDAGKLTHEGDGTLVDCNRCGVPLIEIVTEPDLSDGAEVSEFLKTLRGILVACGVSDCKMQEGSMRCDVNVSVSSDGGKSDGVRTEIKNINSFSFAAKASEYEVQRQIGALERGERILPETRRFNASSGVTERMRSKETGEDYRFFREPDLPDVILTDEWIEKIASEIPELPAEKAKRFEESFGISRNDAKILTSEPGIASWFERAAEKTQYPRNAANLFLTGLIASVGTDPFTCPVPAERLSELADLEGSGRISASTARKLLSRLTESDFSPAEIAEREGLCVIRDEKFLSDAVDRVLAREEKILADYRGGKTNALRALQGKAMAECRGRAEPALLMRILENKLKQ